jgi:nitroreductase
MDFFDVIQNRRSVRKYLLGEVSRETVLKILHAANDAPSAMNLQQWEFIVASGERIRQLGKSYEETSAYPPGSEFRLFAKAYGGAPLVIALVTNATDDPALRKANIESVSAAMENLVLAAAALSLGTCWMTGPLRDERGIRAILGIPDSKEIIALTPLGIPAEVPAKKERKDPDLSEKVTWIDCDIRNERNMK